VRPTSAARSLRPGSLARSDRSSAATQVIGAGQNLTSGADLCGPNPTVHTGDDWREQGLATQPGTPQPVVNGLNLSLSGVSNVTMDLEGATVAVDRSMLLRVRATEPPPCAWSVPGQARSRSYVTGALSPC
jgi:hypothetical protein